MNKTTIKDSVKKQPFKRFVLKVSDGQQFTIEDPDYVAVSPIHDLIIIFEGEHYHVIDTEKVTALEVLA